MKRLGRVLELWRYPVSSLPGERRERLEIGREGVPGDRYFGLFDVETGLAAAPEREPRWRPALFLSCEAGPDGRPLIALPDGTPRDLHDPVLNEELSDYFGFAVAVGSHGATDEPLDRQFPVVSARYVASPVHIVTTSALHALAEIGAFAEVDHRRFRPTILVETDADEGFVENGWIGATLRIGDSTLAVSEPTKRCGMTMIAQPGINEQPDILRHVIRHNSRNFGVYASVANPATIAVGDTVYAEI